MLLWFIPSMNWLTGSIGPARVAPNPGPLLNASPPARIAKVRMSSPEESLPTLAQSSGRCPLLEERDHTLLGAFGRRARPVVEMNGEDRVWRHWRGSCVLRLEFDGFELVSEGLLVGLETRIWDEAVTEEPKPDH